MSTFFNWRAVSDIGLAYDIKSIMDKGLHDIIRPQWIIDCVAASEKVAMSKKYILPTLLISQA